MASQSRGPSVRVRVDERLRSLAFGSQGLATGARWPLSAARNRARAMHNSSLTATFSPRCLPAMLAGLEPSGELQNDIDAQRSQSGDREGDYDILPPKRGVRGFCGLIFFTLLGQTVGDV